MFIYKDLMLGKKIILLFMMFKIQDLFKISFNMNSKKI